MVFPGRLSTGCHVCRRRKVKCDGTKPECHRCIQHGVQCEGYPDKFSFREYKPPEESREPKITPPRRRSKVSSEYLPIQHKASPGVAIPLSADWQSVCSFMNQIVLPVHRSPCEGYLAFLPKLYQERSDDACLKHAILSVSYLTLFQEHKSQKLEIQARKNHGNSLRLLKTALESQDTIVKDEVLAACLLLSIFYSLNQDEPGLPDPHMSGVHHLLRLRGKPQLSSKYGRHLVGWMMIQTQLQALKSKHFKYAELPPFIQTMSKPDSVFRAGIVNSKIARFCQSATDVCNSLRIQDVISGPITSLCSLIEQSQLLMEEIEAWHSSIPGHWKRQYHPEHGTDSDLTPPDPWTTIFLAVNHSTQIIFYQHVLACIDTIEQLDLGSQRWPLEALALGYRQMIESRIRYLVKIICFTVRSNLGEMDSHGELKSRSNAQLSAKFANNTLYWPMQVVVDCPIATADERTLCQLALHYIRPPTENTRPHSVARKNALPTNAVP